MKIKQQEQVPFKDKHFTLEVTGEELLRIWKLSRAAEGGSLYPDGKERIHAMIQGELGIDPEHLEDLFQEGLKL